MRGKIRYKVKRIITHKVQEGRNFYIAEVEILKNYDNIEIPSAVEKVSGYFQGIMWEKNEYEAIGEFVDKGAYGWEFVTDINILKATETERGIALFLEKYAKGTGKKTVESIINTFKLDTIRVIKEEPGRLREVKGVTEKKLQAIIKAVNDNLVDIEDILFRISPLGFSYTEIVKLYDEYGTLAGRLIEENPYKLLDSKIYNYKRAEIAADKLGFKANNKHRIRAGIEAFMKEDLQRRGHLFTYRDNLLENLETFMLEKGGKIYKHEGITAEEILEQVRYLENSYNIKTESDKLYISFYYNIEQNIANMLIRKSRKSNTRQIKASKLKEFNLKNSDKLSSEQAEAITTSLKNQISVLNGGPGTGKTYTLNYIYRAIKELDPLATVELAAPTGKAANRMTESTGIEARTIHRLLGLKIHENQTEEEASRELVEIEADYVIVDEASMIDAYIFYCLLNNLKEDAVLIIVGDYNQLPSVGAGLILREIIESNAISKTILTKVQRQAKGSQIVENAYKVISGNSELSEDNNKGDFYFLRMRKEKESEIMILKSIERLISNKDYNLTLDDVQVLTAKNKGILGVEELNAKIQARFNKETLSLTSGERIFKKGDKVMQTENNYDLDVFNGETGKIIDIDIDKRIVTVDYNGKIIDYENNFSELTLAYAITIHKSQGSEFKACIIALENENAFLSRNLLYTAFTRAKDKLIIIGHPSNFDKGVERIDNKRNSTIKDKLISSLIDKSSII